jgi:hypothetical protein
MAAIHGDGDCEHGHLGSSLTDITYVFDEPAPATTAAGSSSRAHRLVAGRSTLTGEHLAAYVGI